MSGGRSPPGFARRLKRLALTDELRKEKQAVNEEEIAQLEHEDEWDFESAERIRVPKGNRAIVSVGFKTPDFTLVAEAARKRDQPISQFIREAALDRAREREHIVVAHKTITIQMSKATKQIDTLLAEAIHNHGRMFWLR